MNLPRATDGGEDAAEGVEGEVPAGVVQAADVGVGEAQGGQELEQLVRRPEAPADEHGHDGPHAGPGPPGVDDVTEGLEHRHCHDPGDEGVGNLVELEHPRDEPRLIEDRRPMVGRGQKAAGQVDRSGHGQGRQRRPGQRPPPVPGPDQQRQQRPDDQIGHDPPVPLGDSEAGHSRQLGGEGHYQPRRSPHDPEYLAFEAPARKHAHGTGVPLDLGSGIRDPVSYSCPVLTVAAWVNLPTVRSTGGRHVPVERSPRVPGWGS